MKTYKYRDVLSKLDTDKKLDQKIKDHLLNYEVNTKNSPTKKTKKYEKSKKLT